jgi:hypothetical protein
MGAPPKKKEKKKRKKKGPSKKSCPKLASKASSECDYEWRR